jgi:hypothetical protein
MSISLSVQSKGNMDFEIIACGRCSLSFLQFELRSLESVVESGVGSQLEESKTPENPYEEATYFSRDPPVN